MGSVHDRYRSFFVFFIKLNKKSINIFLIIISINEDMYFLKFLIFFKNIILKCYIFVGVLCSINLGNRGVSYLKKKPNRRLDFLPNVQNKYSIRKFTVGAASILVGATLIFGAGQEEAKAAESDQTVTNQDNTSSPTDTTDQPSTEEKATSESTTTDQPSTEEKVTSDSTETNKPSSDKQETTSDVIE